MTQQDNVLYRTYRGSHEEGILFLVEGTSKDHERVVFKLLELRQKQRQCMLVSFLSIPSLRVVYQTLLAGTFEKHYPEGFKEWGRTLRNHCMGSDGLLVEDAPEVRLFTLQKKQDIYSIRIACFKEERDKKCALVKSLGVNMRPRELLEMLDQLVRSGGHDENFVIKGKETTGMSTTRGMVLVPSRVKAKATVRRENKKPQAKRAVITPARVKMANIVKDVPKKVDERLEVAMAPVATSSTNILPEVDEALKEIETAVSTSSKSEDAPIRTSLELVRLFVAPPHNLHAREHEEAHVVWFDKNGCVIRTQQAGHEHKIMSLGGAWEVRRVHIDLVSVFGSKPPAADGLALVHNHPAEDVPEPSPEDSLATRRLLTALGRLDIAFFDHVIIGRRGWYSFRQQAAFIGGF